MVHDGEQWLVGGIGNGDESARIHWQLCMNVDIAVPTYVRQLVEWCYLGTLGASKVRDGLEKGADQSCGPRDLFGGLLQNSTSEDNNYLKEKGQASLVRQLKKQLKNPQILYISSDISPESRNMWTLEYQVLLMLKLLERTKMTSPITVRNMMVCLNLKLVGADSQLAKGNRQTMRPMVLKLV